jgi:hypothetical protein
VPLKEFHGHVAFVGSEARPLPGTGGWGSG